MNEKLALKCLLYAANELDGPQFKKEVDAITNIMQRVAARPTQQKLQQTNNAKYGPRLQQAVKDFWRKYKTHYPAEADALQNECFMVLPVALLDVGRQALKDSGADFKFSATDKGYENFLDQYFIDYFKFFLKQAGFYKNESQEEDFDTWHQNNINKTKDIVPGNLDYSIDK